MRLVSARATLDLAAALADALDGSGPAVEVVPARGPHHAVGTRGGPAPDADAGPGARHGGASATAVEVPDDVAVVVRTSGSTGDPHGVLLTTAALRASASATAARLGGPGRWLLTLPTEHVAGLQVVVRSVLAGGEPVVGAGGAFRANSFAAAVRRLVDATDGAAPSRRYGSLVPTQLYRALASPQAVAALRDLDAVLVGGAATGDGLLQRARDAGVPVVTTYGMSETCGGCVYDDRPLDGVRVGLQPDGRVLLAGPVLARGYLGRPDLDEQAFVRRDGVRWLRTGDVGEITSGPEGTRLRVLGRIDDVVVTGGVNVLPAAVERVIGALDGVDQVCVVDLPDPEWGRAIVALVVPSPGSRVPVDARVRAEVAAALGRAAAPRRVLLVDALPLRGPGKPDRQAARRLAAAALGPASP